MDNQDHKIEQFNVLCGFIRLVNPWRGLVLCANLVNDQNNTTLSVRTDDFRKFSIYTIIQGKEFYCGRSFARKELYSWLSGEIPPPDEQLLVDEFGDIPCVQPNPQSWVWYCVDGQGERRLKTQFCPTGQDIQRIAGIALSLSKEQFYPLIDPFELWVCDKETEEPLALVMTGTSLDDIGKQTFSPMWRCNWQKVTITNEVDLRKLEARINQRINTSNTPGRFGWKQRLFRRNLDGSAIEYQEFSPITHHPIGYLPNGILAEPFETERKKLEDYTET